MPACSPPDLPASPNAPPCSQAPSLEAVGALPPCTGLSATTLFPLNPSSSSSQGDPWKGDINQMLTSLCLTPSPGSRFSSPSPSLGPQIFYNPAGITSLPPPPPSPGLTLHTLFQASLLWGNTLSVNLPLGLCNCPLASPPDVCLPVCANGFLSSKRLVRRTGLPQTTNLK